MKDKITLFICAMVCFTLIISGILFWPTLYRYDKTKLDSNQYLVKVNRFTGYTEILYSNGWEKKESVKQVKDIHKEDTDKIVLKGDFDGKGNYKCTFYNGTDWNIKKIRLSIETLSIQGKKVVQRIYEIPVTIPPFSTDNSYSIRLMNYAPQTFAGGRWVLQEDPKEGKARLLSDEELTLINKFHPEVKIEEVFGYKSE